MTMYLHDLKEPHEILHWWRSWSIQWDPGSQSLPAGS